MEISKICGHESSASNEEFSFCKKCGNILFDNVNKFNNFLGVNDKAWPIQFQVRIQTSSNFGKYEKGE